MANVGPPPLQDPDINSQSWREWFRRLLDAVGGSGSAGLFSSLDFTASNITSIVTRNHDDTQSISVSSGTDYNHLTDAELAAVNGATDSITAGSTQTQAGATALNGGFSRVTVVATDGDGVKLPTAIAGLAVEILNDDAAQNIQIWPNTDDAIDGGAVDAVDANTLAAGATRRYRAIDGVNWHTMY